MKILFTTIKNECIHSKLALKYLNSVVAEAPIDSTVREFEESDSREDIYDELVREQAEMVYFHCNMLNEQRIAVLADMIKKARPTSIVVMGGYEVTFDSYKYMEEHPYVDYILRGEVETVLFNFVKSLLSYEFDFASIPGLAYRDEGIMVNPLDTPIRYEELDFPYDNEELDGDNDVYYQSFRGEPDRCAYAQVLPDRRIRALSLNRICTELRYFIVKKVKSVTFIEKWFNFNTDRAFRIWEYLINNDNGTTKFIFDVNGDLLDEETIRLLASARKGLFEFNIDIESTNAASLSAVGRKENIYQLMYNVSKLLQSKTVKVNVVLRIGLPFETADLFSRSFNKAYGLGASSMNVELVNLKKGTLLREEAAKFGYVYSASAPYEIIANDFLTAPEIVRIRRITNVSKLYSENGVFSQSIPRIMKDVNAKPYELFEMLTDYIEEKNYKGILDKPGNLHRILYSFATMIYDDLNETMKLPLLMEIIHSDLEREAGDDEVKEFDRKGWVI